MPVWTDPPQTNRLHDARPVVQGWIPDTDAKPSPSGVAGTKVWRVKTGNVYGLEFAFGICYSIAATAASGLVLYGLVRLMLTICHTLACLQAWFDYLIDWAAYIGFGAAACTLPSVISPLVSPVAGCIYSYLGTQASQSLWLQLLQPNRCLPTLTLESYRLVVLLSCLCLDALLVLDMQMVLSMDTLRRAP